MFYIYEDEREKCNCCVIWKLLYSNMQMSLEQLERSMFHYIWKVLVFRIIVRTK